MILSNKDILEFATGFEKQIQEEVDNGDWYIEEEKNSPMEVVIKPDALDTSLLDGGDTETKKAYRPQVFSEYVGQDKAKARVGCYIKGCQKFGEVFPHTFLSAPAGHGKTLFANILANVLGKKMVVCTGGDLKSEQAVVDKIVECQGGVLFVDESHRLSKRIGTFMLPILEEFLVSGMKIKPLTFIFATTHKGNMSEHLEALIQRFQLDIELEHYNNEELENIFKQYHNKMYPSINIEDNVFKNISDNCRFTPRLGQSLLKEYAYIEDWDTVKRNNKIVKDGVTVTDIKVLKYLNDNGGLGKNTISKFLKIEPKTYEFEVEPYLIFKELITVGSRRLITEKGKVFLNEIKTDNI